MISAQTFGADRANLDATTLLDFTPMFELWRQTLCLLQRKKFYP